MIAFALPFAIGRASGEGAVGGASMNLAGLGLAILSASAGVAVAIVGAIQVRRDARSPSDDVPRLRRELHKLLALSESIFSRRIQFDADNHLAFMALLFAGRQAEHARSVLALDKSIDAVLITRSMFEGLSQLLWAAQEPTDRPLRFRTFAFVRDWRTMRKQIVDGIAVSPERQRYIEDGLRAHGTLFLTDKARKAEAQGLPLPDDPYMWNWYGEKEKEIFSAVEGDLAYAELYGPFSEWHHWRIGGFGFLLKFDEPDNTFRMTGQNPSLTVTALASAWQCLWQTLVALDEIVSVGIRGDLDRLRKDYLSGHQQTE